MHAVADMTRGLLKLGMQDPRCYAPLYGAEVAHMHPDQLRLFLAFRMAMFDLRTGFALGVITPEALNHKALPNLFRQPEAREYWAMTRDEWLNNTPTPSCRRFAEVIDKAYHDAAAAGAPAGAVADL